MIFLLRSIEPAMAVRKIKRESTIQHRLHNIRILVLNIGTKTKSPRNLGSLLDGIIYGLIGIVNIKVSPPSGPQSETKATGVRCPSNAKRFNGGENAHYRWFYDRIIMQRAMQNI